MVTTPPIVVSAFYKFVAVDDRDELIERVRQWATDADMWGSVLVAGEGINGTVAGTRSATDRFFSALRSDERFADLRTKESFTAAVPFKRMKVRPKGEIVTFRQPVDPTERVGRYVSSRDWNEVLADPDVLVVDTRNDEEVQLGTFEGAVNPETTSFTEFAAWADALDPSEHPRVAMFCTGGIRCEKATSYLLDRGFDDVMHLDGGILQYLEDVPVDESRWQGECFVFDERVSVDHDLKPGSHSLCRGCRRVLNQNDLDAPDYEEGVACPGCASTLTDERRASLRERQLQERLAVARGERHVGRVDERSG